MPEPRIGPVPTGAAIQWIFGYGSLMWNPGFAHLHKRRAVLRGYHRAYMMYSTRNRGAPGCPGMVLSLAPGAQCVGMAFQPDPAHLTESLAYLDKREGLGRAHRRCVVPLEVETDEGPRIVPGTTYLPILTYSNYIGGVPLRRQAELVAIGRGGIGSSYDYLRLLMEELSVMEVAEPTLERLFRETNRVRERLGLGAPDAPMALHEIDDAPLPAAGS